MPQTVGNHFFAPCLCQRQGLFVFHENRLYGFVAGHCHGQGCDGLFDAVREELGPQARQPKAYADSLRSLKLLKKVTSRAKGVSWACRPFRA